MMIRKLTKFNHTMGFQITHSNKPKKVKPFSCPNNDDDNNGGTNGGSLIPGDVPGYASWLVNIFSIIFYWTLHCMPCSYSRVYMVVCVLFSQAKHPSALNMFDSITKEAKGKKLVVFLDYDGTLSPIVDDPDKAFMSAEVPFHINIALDSHKSSFV